MGNSGILKWLKLLTYSPSESIRYNTDAATRLSIITMIEWNRIIDLTNDNGKCVILQTLCFIRNLICSNVSDISGKMKKEIFIGMSDDCGNESSDNNGGICHDPIVTEYFSMIIEVVDNVLVNMENEEQTEEQQANSPKLSPKTSPTKPDLQKSRSCENNSSLTDKSFSASSTSISTSITKSHH